jgi:SET domain-containing protein
MNEFSTMQRCNYCSKEAEKLLRCSACKQVHYCDAHHQKSDWPNHKSNCKALQQRKQEDPIDTKYKKQAPSLHVRFYLWYYLNFERMIS